MSSNASPSRPSAAGALGCGCVALVALLGVVVLLFVGLAWGSAGSPDYPRVAPEEMADRAFQRSQEAYDVLGFTRTVPPGVEKVGVSTENTFDSGFCYDGGLLGMDDRTVDGAYAMSHEWALDQVPASQAVARAAAAARAVAGRRVGGHVVPGGQGRAGLEPVRAAGRR